MRAITVHDRDAGLAGLSLTDLPYPHAAENDVVVRVHSAGLTRGELDCRRRGPIERVATGPRACRVTRCPASSPISGTGPPA